MESLFSERLRFIRAQKKLTLDEIAYGINSNKSTLSQYENGKRKADQKMIIKISEYLGVSADYMLGLTDDPSGRMTPKKVNEYHRLSGGIREFFSNSEISQGEKDKMFKEITTMYWKYKK